MTLKREYKPTRGGARDLARDAKPGDILYVVRDISAHVAPYEDSKLYSQYTVLNKRAPLSGPWMTDGGCSVVGLLHHYGTVYSQKPSGMRSLTGTRSGPTDREVAEALTRSHKADLAKDRRESVAAGSKRGFFR